MKSFVTGGAGFIGSHLVDRLLKRGDTVTVYDNLSFGKKDYLKPHLGNPKFKLLKKDLLKIADVKKAVKGQDFVYHLAANSDIMRSMTSPSIDFEMGIVATFNLLEGMREAQVNRLVYFSGSGVYGDGGETFLKETDSTSAPQSMYGAAKLSSEGMISTYSHLYGIQSWIFRPANIIGPRPTHGVIYDFIQKLKKNPRELEVLGNGTQSKSYIYVDDVLDAVFFAAERSKHMLNTFNVASESVIDVKTIAGMVVRAMALSGVKIQYGKESRGWKGDIPVVRLSIEKLKALGWKPKWNSEEAVSQTIREILEKDSKHRIS